MEYGEFCDVLAGHQAKVFIADQGRNGRKSAAGKEDCGGAKDEVEMLRMRDQGEEDQQGESMGPPDYVEKWCGRGELEVDEIGDHQDEDQEGDETRLPGDFAEPLGAPDESADGESGDGDGGDHGECGGQPADGVTVHREQRPADANGEVVQRDDAEGAKSPENEGVEQARKRTLLNHLRLADDFPEEVPDPAGEGVKLEVSVGLGLA